MPPLPTRIILLTAVAALPAAAAEKITYEDHIFPIFEQSCLNCHNPDKPKGGLDLSSYSGTMRGGSGGKIAEPGDGAGSVLFTSVTHTSENKMPPEGDKIAKAQADLIRTWIDGGLLETKDSTAKKRTGPKIDLTVKVDPGLKPDGPPPMPEGLSLEPAVVAARSTALADMAASPWAPLLAITGQKQVLLYNTDTLQLAGVLPFPAGQPETLAFHPNGNYLLAGGGVPGKSGTTVTWDITTGQEILQVGRAFDSILGGDVRPDLSGVAFGGPSRLVKIHDTASGEETKSIKKHTDWVTGLAYSPDGILLATADRNGGCWVWEAESGIEFHNLRGHQGGITTLRWRADSNLLATASEDGQVIFWEMRSGKQAKKVAAHGGGVLSFDYARDGHFVTSGRDRKVKVWKPDFSLKKELPAFDHLVVEVAITHDAKRFFTADWNGTVTVWDAEKFTRLGELNANPPTIAARLAWLEKKLEELPPEIAAARQKLTTAEQAVAGAKAAHRSAIDKRDEAKQRIERLTKETKQLAQEWSQLDTHRKQLATTRDQQKAELLEARNAKDGNRTAVTQATLKLQDLQNHTLIKEHAKQADEVEVFAKQLAKHPDNDKLQASLDEAKRRLTQIEAKLVAREKQINTAKEFRQGLTQEGKQLQTRFHAAEAAWNNSTAEWTKIEERRQQISARRQDLNRALPEVRKSLPGLEQALKPAQELITAKEQALPPLRTALKSLQTRQTGLQQALTFWKAAAEREATLQAAAASKPDA